MMASASVGAFHPDEVMCPLMTTVPAVPRRTVTLPDPEWMDADAGLPTCSVRSNRPSGPATLGVG